MKEKPIWFKLLNGGDDDRLEPHEHKLPCLNSVRDLVIATCAYASTLKKPEKVSQALKAQAQAHITSLQDILKATDDTATQDIIAEKIKDIQEGLSPTASELPEEFYEAIQMAIDAIQEAQGISPAQEEEEEAPEAEKAVADVA